MLVPRPRGARGLQDLPRGRETNQVQSSSEADSLRVTGQGLMSHEASGA